MPKSDKRTVSILGWYGHRNIGDDEVVLSGLKKLFYDWNINVYTNDPNKRYPLFNPKEVNKTDLFVLGGGSLINSERLFMNGDWIKKVKVPKIILGCGVNTESAEQLRKEVIKGLERFSYIGLRDEMGVHILNSINRFGDRVDLFYDAAFALTSTLQSIDCNHQDNYAVVIPTDRFTRRYDQGIRYFGITTASWQWLTQRLMPFDKTVFLPFGIEDNNDFQTCLLLSSLCKNSEIIEPDLLDLQKAVQTIANSSSVFAYRLHGLILSFILKKQYEFFPYHWKLNRVYNTIKGKDPLAISVEQKQKFEKVISEVVG